MKQATQIVIVLSAMLFHFHAESESQSNKDAFYENPVIAADYSDPDVIRVGDDYYMVASSFNCVPGLPVLHSNDLVSWKIIGHVLQRLPSPMFDTPQHGKGVWAPSIRYHNNEYWVYYGDPDLGIFMSKAKKAEGPWEPATLVKEAKGWIDPCPLWDDDGNAYLVHAWAKSRVGFNSILTVNKMSTDGKSIFDEGVEVFNGIPAHPTIEGPKFYKRNGYYYIFAPAGGVAKGWQTVLRSKSVYGPYEDNIVLHQGATEINGPHQGAWVESQNGDSWFIHFQEKQPYGRIIHLQPMIWKNDIPVIGNDDDGDGIGEPVLRWNKPNAGTSHEPAVHQTSDEFTANIPGLQWQWHANPQQEWFSLTSSPGKLRLNSIDVPEGSVSMWDMPNLLLQKFSANTFSATTLMRYHHLLENEKAGLIVMGLDYAYVAVKTDGERYYVGSGIFEDAETGTREQEIGFVPVQSDSVFLRVTVNEGGVCVFSMSADGKEYHSIGGQFQAREGKWIGAKVGLFAVASQEPAPRGFAEFDWFRIE